MRRSSVPWQFGVCIAIFGIAMMGYGIWRGEAAVVFTKAVRICLECIGIG